MKKLILGGLLIVAISGCKDDTLTVSRQAYEAQKINLRFADSCFKYVCNNDAKFQQYRDSSSKYATIINTLNTIK